MLFKQGLVLFDKFIFHWGEAHAKRIRRCHKWCVLPVDDAQLVLFLRHRWFDIFREVDAPPEVLSRQDCILRPSGRLAEEGQAARTRHLALNLWHIKFFHALDPLQAMTERIMVTSLSLLG